MKLNFDTRWNILPCMVTLFKAAFTGAKICAVNPISHYQFNEGLFFLILEEHVIKQFEEAIVFQSHSPPILQVFLQLRSRISGKGAY